MPFGGWRKGALVTGSGAAGAVAAAAVVCATGGPPFSVPRTGPAAPFGSGADSRTACAGKRSINALLMSGSSCGGLDILEHLRAGPRVCQKMCGAVGANRRTFLNCGEALPAGPHRRFALAMMFRISSYTVTSSANRSCTQRHADHARSRHSQRTPSERTFIRPIRP